MRIRSIAFHPWRDGWHDVVLAFDKLYPARIGIDAIELRGMVRWLPLADQPANFTLVANSLRKFRFGAISPTDFDAFIVRHKCGVAAKVRLALRSGESVARRVCVVSSDAIVSSETAWLRTETVE